jgi:hypothetical protein
VVSRPLICLTLIPRRCLLERNSWHSNGQLSRTTRRFTLQFPGCAQASHVLKATVGSSNRGHLGPGPLGLGNTRGGAHAHRLMPLRGSANPVARKPQRLTSCNCSICRRQAGLWGYYEPSKVKITARKGDIHRYVWGDKCLSLCRCATCGCVTHWQLIARGGNRMGVNFQLRSLGHRDNSGS